MPGTRPGGSIIVLVGTSAPLLGQCDRLAQRAALGIARVGGVGENSSGDLFLCFASGNRGLPVGDLAATTRSPSRSRWSRTATSRRSSTRSSRRRGGDPERALRGRDDDRPPRDGRHELPTDLLVARWAPRRAPAVAFRQSVEDLGCLGPRFRLVADLPRATLAPASKRREDPDECCRVPAQELHRRGVGRLPCRDDGGLNPATGETIAEVPASTAEDADRAVQAAKAPSRVARHDAARARGDAPQARGRDRGERRGARADRVRNVGKPIAAARDEPGEMADNLRFFAGAARMLEGRSTGEYMRSTRP